MVSGKGIKKLFASAGYIRLFDSDRYTFDLTSGKKYLRKTIRKRDPQNGGLNQHEEHYILVTDKDEREVIKKISDRWIPYRDGIRNDAYIVYAQKNSENYLTGYYKTVEKVMNEDDKRENWVRYYKRVGETDDEIQRR